MNRTRFHSLSSEFSLSTGVESSEIHSSTKTPQRVKSLHSIGGVNYSLDFFKLCFFYRD